jgi:PadR family transcriptional regulator, regulatory protein PadR
MSLDYRLIEGSATSREKAGNDRALSLKNILPYTLYYHIFRSEANMAVIDPRDEKWKTQFKKGFLELCILSLVKRKRKTYGFEMLDSLKGHGLDIGEGTLYPLLTRLSAESKLEAEWETPGSGGAVHPRKFYRLSTGATELLAAMESEFEGQYRVYESIKGGKA